MRFLKGLWKLLVGVKDALVLLAMLVFFGLLYAVLSFSPHAGGPSRGALVLRLDGPVVEQPAEADPSTLLTGGSIPRQYRLAEVIRTLDAAAADDNIPAVVLDLDIFAGGRQSAISDVGAAIDRVRAAGKPVLAYATAFSDDTYQLAAHASEVWMNPLGGVLIAGPGGDNLYYAGLMERLGITANVYRVGAWKSAVEPYTRRDMSPEARDASNALAQSLWTSYRDEIRRVRPNAQVDAYANAPSQTLLRNNGDLAEAALRMGLVDRVADRATFNARVAQIAGDGGTNSLDGSYRAVPFANYLERNPLGQAGGDIAVLTVAGEIRDGEAGPGTAGAETIVRTLDEGMRRGSFKALVVRVDSPGGSVLASERIRLAIQAVRDRGIPVVVSMGSVAASGGYWISMPGQRIFAEPTTITGSIGVFGVLPSFEGALRQLGVGADGVRTTPLSGEPNILRGPSDEANRTLQLGVEASYRRFLVLVSRARGLPVERVHQIAQGRVWDGGTAHQLGLVDQFGNLADAIRDAAQRANLDPANARVTYLAPQTSWLQRLLGSAGQSAMTAPSVSTDPFARATQRPQILLARALDEARGLLDGPVLQARCLECPPAADPAPAQASRTLWAALAGRIGL